MPKDLRINEHTIYTMVDCPQDSPVFEEVRAEYQQVLGPFYESLQPAAWIGRENRPETAYRALGINGDFTSLIYVILSAGGQVCELANAYLTRGAYMSGLLVHAMADSYLFEMEAELTKTLADQYSLRGYGIACRLAAPEDFPLSGHRYICQCCDARKDTGMQLTQGDMFDPEKTMCMVFGLKKGKTDFVPGHDCGKCTAVNCKLRERLARDAADAGYR